MKRVSIDPITRIEGHLKIELDIESGRVKSARSSGTLFRGLEEMLRGRDPRDAQRITQRVCGVCPAAHAIASAQALDDAFGIRSNIPPNGRLERNLMLGGNFIHSHVLHFYHLSALDYLNPHDLEELELEDVTLRDLQSYLKTSDGAPFTHEYTGDYRLGTDISSDLARDYLEALEVRKKAHQMVSIFGGKMPHNMGTVAGGATSRPDIDSITKFMARLEEIEEFVESRYLPGVVEVAKIYDDYFEIGKGVPNFLDYGGFYLESSPDSHNDTRKSFLGGVVSEGEEEVRVVDFSQITEEIEHSWYGERARGHPTETRSTPSVNKEGGYSWVKAPRYENKPHEVGPAARMRINYLSDNGLVKPEMTRAMNTAGIGIEQLNSVMGRHLCRAVECRSLVKMMKGWVEELRPNEPSCAGYEMPDEGEGMGLACAPRGTLGHWIRIREGKIANYQLVVPTTWNASPRDRRGVPGPIEQSLIGSEIQDPDNPLEAARIVRSFDPCMACAVH